MSSPPTFRAAWQSGLRGARANLGPGLVLQAFALALVLGYYFLPGVAEALKHLADLRERMGVSYAMISTALFGGLIPWIYIKAHPATRHRYTVAQGGGLILFWAYKGFEMHWLYGGPFPACGWVTPGWREDSRSSPSSRVSEPGVS